MEKGGNLSFSPSPLIDSFSSPLVATSTFPLAEAEPLAGAMSILRTPEGALNSQVRRQPRLDDLPFNDVGTSGFYNGDGNLDKVLLFMNQTKKETQESVFSEAFLNRLKYLVSNVNTNANTNTNTDTDISVITVALRTLSKLVIDEDEKQGGLLDSVSEEASSSLLNQQKNEMKNLPENQQKNKLKNLPENQQKNKLKPNTVLVKNLPENRQKNEVKPNTVLVKNLPDNQTLEDVRRIFGKFGEIMNISLKGIDGKVMKEHIGPIDQKIHVFIDYNTLSAANDAVSRLNDESNWRSGMRVELLTEASTSKHKTKKKKKKNRKKQDHNVDDEKEKLQPPIQQQQFNATGKNRKKQDHNVCGEKEKLQPPVQKQQYNATGKNRIKHGQNIVGEKEKPQPLVQQQQRNEIGSRWRRAAVATNTAEYSSKIPSNHIPKTPDGTKGFTMDRAKTTQYLSQKSKNKP